MEVRADGRLLFADPTGLSVYVDGRRIGNEPVPPGPVLPYDAEVEYLESTGTQWIDTGVVYHGGSTLRFDVRLPPYRKYGVLFSDGENSSVKITRLIWGTSSSQAIINNNAYAPGSILDSRMVVDVGEDRRLVGWISTTDCFCNGTSWGVRGPWIENGANPNASIVLFAGRSSTGVYLANAGARIGRFAIDGICDLKAVRVGTTGYLYDRVSGRLFGNQGTGNFVLGPDK